jgi:hypothetical protein
MNGSEDNTNEKTMKRVDLKYCERCGGLWLRECGSGLIYCEACRGEVAQLPIPKKRPQRVELPAFKRPVIDDFRFDASGERDGQGLRRWSRWRMDAVDERPTDSAINAGPKRGGVA